MGVHLIMDIVDKINFVCHLADFDIVVTNLTIAVRKYYQNLFLYKFPL
jgi:hypothetical protein